MLAFTLIEADILSQPYIQVTWKPLKAGGCLLLNESSAESSCELSALLSCSNKPKICLVLYGCLTQVLLYTLLS